MLCSLKRSIKALSGKAVLLIIDFRQVVAVKLAGIWPKIMRPCFERSRFYLLFRYIYLLEIIRLSALRRYTSADQPALRFSSFLFDVGD